MPWEEKKDKPHACHQDGGVPTPTDALYNHQAHEGSKYRCDICGKMWVLTNDAREGSWCWVEYFPHPGD